MAKDIVMVRVPLLQHEHRIAKARAALAGIDLCEWMASAVRQKAALEDAEERSRPPQPAVDVEEAPSNGRVTSNGHQAQDQDQYQDQEGHAE